MKTTSLLLFISLLALSKVSLSAQGIAPSPWFNKAKEEAIKSRKVLLPKRLPDGTLQLDSTGVQLYDTLLVYTPIKEDSLTISIIADGLTQQSIGASDNLTLPTNFSVGVSLKRYFKREYWIRGIHASFGVGVGSSPDVLRAKYEGNEITNRRDFGSSLLVPINGELKAQSLFVTTRYFMGRIYRRSSKFYSKLFNQLIGSQKELLKQHHDSILAVQKRIDTTAKSRLKCELKRIRNKYKDNLMVKMEEYGVETGNNYLVPSFEFQISSTNRLWNFRPNPMLSDSITRNVTLVALRIGPSFEFLRFKDIRNDYSIRVGIFWTARILAGDLGFEDDKQGATNDLRKALLDVENTFFNGIEPSLEFVIKNLRISASFPIMFGGAKVNGLTGAQFLVGAGLTIGTPPIRLN